MRLRRDARDEVVDGRSRRRRPSVASKRMVSFENPVLPGISRWSTVTPSRPATSPSQRCSWATVWSWSRDTTPTDGNLTPRHERRLVSGARRPLKFRGDQELARMTGRPRSPPRTRRGRHGARADRRPGVLPRHHAEVPRERVPDPQGARAARRTTPASSATTGARAPSWAGRRCSCPRSSAAAASAATASSTSRSWPTSSARTSRPARCSRATSSPPRWPARAATQQQAESSPPSSPASVDRHLGRHRAAARTTRLGDVALRRRGRRRRLVLTGVKSPVEAGAQADQLLVTATHRRRPRPVPGARRRRRRHRHAAARASTSSGASPASSSTGSRSPASALVGDAGRRRRRRRAPAAARRRDRRSAEMVGATQTPCSTSPSSGRSTATRSAGRWRRTRSSSTASPT